MLATIKSPLTLGSLTIPHRLIQGPLAGYSCAPFRVLFNQFVAPAYCVTEMCSAQDVLSKHDANSRYLYRDANESLLAYQISGTDPELMANAALKLQNLGADLIDLNCGCPKPKIRKKGAGSALVENPDVLMEIIQAVRAAISIPLTVKIRIQGNEKDVQLAQQIQAAKADALVVHGRTWREEYATPCNLEQIAAIKKSVSIPVIANGDIKDYASLERTFATSHCDAFMIGRAGTGKPWLYQELLNQQPMQFDLRARVDLFVQHLQGLAQLESEFKAIMQAKSLIRYYFRQLLSEELLQKFYQLQSIKDIDCFLISNLL